MEMNVGRTAWVQNHGRVLITHVRLAIPAVWLARAILLVITVLVSAVVLEGIYKQIWLKLDSVKNAIWLHVSVAMAITVMVTVQEQHAKKDSKLLIIRNAERTVWLIKLGWVRIIVVNVTVVSFGWINFKAVLCVIKIVRSVEGLMI
jgi:hypothetical protein